KNLGLDDEFTLLIMGGSLGFGEIEKVFLSLLNNFDRDMQIIIVAGKNQHLKNRLDMLKKNSNRKVLILGYTDNISELMDASDIIITKPGGMTVSEALAKGLPMVIISPIPGQEERNADFLISNGVALKTTDTDTFKRALGELINNPDKLNSMKKKCSDLIDAKGGQEIMRLMENLILEYELNQISSLYL
ncbi:MAG: glycosyltransferase, partial [Clostridiaceae bacterium]|nr:glycosyltransferase [Clostridiaceae bacterium]